MRACVRTDSEKRSISPTKSMLAFAMVFTYK